ncbi:MAG TPA: tetratricopeptide repeat protein [Phycisphaerales bacterium]|nr:tetratricopeptide repeat protein [Phycisphaerales bacterium]
MKRSFKARSSRLPLALLLGAMSGAAGAVARADEPAAGQTNSAAVADGSGGESTLTAEAALDRFLSKSKEITPEFLSSADELFNKAAKDQPKDYRWTLGRAFVLMSRNEPVKARDTAREAAKLAPESAVAQCWLGNAVFQSIDQAGFFEKMSLANEGFAAYEKAVKLDPNYIDPRVGLFQFYYNAPGIAGGSIRKAREQAKAMCSLPGRGPFTGQCCLAQCAAYDEKWDELASACAAAVKAAETPEDLATAHYVHANGLLNKKEDPQAAIEVLGPLTTGEPKPEEVMLFYLLGDAKRKLKDWAGAKEALVKVINVKADAKNSRFVLAECCEKLGDIDGAITHYSEFAKRFPDDDRAKQANSAVKRLQKQKAK